MASLRTGEYVVESIEDEKYVRQRGGRRVHKYSVRWVGWVDPTWEPASNLKNCPEKVAAYRANRDAGDANNPSNEVQAPAAGAATDIVDDENINSVKLGIAPKGFDVSPMTDVREEGGRGDDDRGADDPMASDRESSAEQDRTGNADYYAEVFEDDYERFPSDDDKDSAYEDEETKESSIRSSESNESDHTTTYQARLQQKRTQKSTPTTSKAKQKAKRKVKPSPKKAAITQQATAKRKPKHVASRKTAIVRRTGQDGVNGFLGSEEEGSGDESERSGDDEDGDDINTILEVEQASSDDDKDDIDDGVSRELTSEELREMADDGFVDAYYGHNRDQGYEAADLCEDVSELSPEAEAAARTMRPIDVFFFFLPKRLWRDIAFQRTASYYTSSSLSSKASVAALCRAREVRRTVPNVMALAGLMALEVLQLAATHGIKMKLSQHR